MLKSVAVYLGGNDDRSTASVERRADKVTQRIDK
jgi:hypothetical protein